MGSCLDGGGRESRHHKSRYLISVKIWIGFRGKGWRHPMTNCNRRLLIITLSPTLLQIINFLDKERKLFSISFWASMIFCHQKPVLQLVWLFLIRIWWENYDLEKLNIVGKCSATTAPLSPPPVSLLWELLRRESGEPGERPSVGGEQ